MKNRIHTKRSKKTGQTAISILIPVLLAVLLGCVWTYYFDLNDDSLMKQILSGEYTGTPETRNIQSCWPLTALIAGLYHLFPKADVYGIFLLILQFGCLALVLARLVKLTGDAGKTASNHFSELAPKSGSGNTDNTAGSTLITGNDRTGSGRHIYYVLMLILAVCLFLGFMLYHLVFLQYSVTVGILAATAAFYFLTLQVPETHNHSEEPESSEAWRSDEATDCAKISEKGKAACWTTREGSAGYWIRQLLPGMILVWTGFLLRSEMMMFLSPLVGLAFLIRLSDMKSSVIHRLRVLLLAVLLAAAGLLAGYAVNQAAYSSPEWKNFYEVFDARTRLYDFEKIPTWENDRAFYESIGLDESEARLIQNYNFGIDDRIDAKVLNQIADYAEEKATASRSFGQRMRNAFWDYRHAFTTEQNRPYVIVLTALYLLVLIRLIVEAVSCYNAAHDKEGGSSGGRREHNRTEQGRAKETSAAGLSGDSNSSAGNPSGNPSDEQTVYRAGSPVQKSVILRFVWLILLLLIRSGLLLYLYYHQRPVDRLTHSLYLVEAVILAWIVLSDASGLFDEKRSPAGIRFRTAGAAATILASLAAVVLQVQTVNAEQTARTENNMPYTAINAYAAQHPENVYFLDVYSTVDFSDRVYTAERVPVNQDILGGWAAKSPLEMEKLRALGCDEAVAADADPEGATDNTSLIIQEALLYSDNCYVAVKAEPGEDHSGSTISEPDPEITGTSNHAAGSGNDSDSSSLQWLVDYYRFRGTDAALERVDQVMMGLSEGNSSAGDGDACWDIYRVYTGLSAPSE